VTEGFTEKETATMDYIQSILVALGLTAVLVLEREEGGVRINITGEGLGSIIGRRGETLDAIQYLASLISNRMDGDYMRVTVDCGNYRNKRKETLEVLAKKLAQQVLKTNVSKTLEPMNPFERRVIHATVSKIEGVSSSSVGEEPNRRVVITSPTARRPYPPRRDGDRRPPRSRDGNAPREQSAERPERTERTERPERPERAPYRGRPSGDRNDRGNRGDRGDRGGDNRRTSTPPRVPRSEVDTSAFTPPKPTPETELMANASVGKRDLE
jgi:spoIIIJ-associated protein